MIFIDYPPPPTHHLIALFFSKVNSQWWLDWCVESQEPESAAFHPGRLALCRVCSISRVRSSPHVRPSASPEPTTRKTGHSRWVKPVQKILNWIYTKATGYYITIRWLLPVCINIRTTNYFEKKYLTQFWPNFFIFFPKEIVFNFKIQSCEPIPRA